MSTPLYIHSVGLACPLGLTADAACIAIQTGLTRREELAFVGLDGEPIVGSFVGQFEEGLTARQRWIALLGHAIEDTMRGMPRGLLEQLPIVCALPDQPNLPTLRVDTLASRVGAAVGMRLEVGAFQTLARGAYGGFQALAHARSMLLATRRVPAVLVCAADSLIGARSLMQMQATGRLLSVNNSDGVTPGEAAACLLVSTQRAGAIAVVNGIGFGEEPALPANDLPLRADGVVEAARGCLTEAARAIHDLDFRLSDAAGQGYHFKEQALLVSRMLRQRKHNFPLQLPAASLGDVGAAAGLCGLSWATTAFRAGYAPGARAIAFAGDGHTGRAAVVLDATGSER
ncbi:hypothetical protein [Enhygromyxa salina]|uniref:3-oxoacyl-(Acyl carrier protein) synthase n=1 Tax=Enhygromyxa salina TaxID=215803 RepID=A0A2S9Y0E6_9BACT|nr:hypothetical protein [Enhygromyxa salina]PRP98566.1 3-oxoacyl-(acyl carrier protein) synthase [Enhygromyxa salina]